MTTIDTAKWKSIGPDLWQSTKRADLIVSLNGTGTMWTIETADQIGDFFDEREAWKTADQLADA